jgi:hypothetical protein
MSFVKNTFCETAKVRKFFHFSRTMASITELFESLRLKLEQEDVSEKQLLNAMAQLVKVFNENQKKHHPENTRRLIVESHWRGCRCGSCWYTFEGQHDVEYEVPK